MFGLGMGELIAIFGILLLLFGAKRLPEIASGLGGAVNSFRKSLKDTGEDSIESAKTIDANKQLDGDQESKPA